MEQLTSRLALLIGCRIVFWGLAAATTVWLIYSDVYSLGDATSFLRTTFAEAQVAFAQGRRPDVPHLYLMGIASMLSFLACIWILVIKSAEELELSLRLRRIDSVASAILLTHAHFLIRAVVGPLGWGWPEFFLYVIFYGYFLAYCPTRYFGPAWVGVVPMIVLWPQFVLGLGVSHFGPSESATAKDAWISLGFSVAGGATGLLRSAWLTDKQGHHANRTER